MLARAHICAKHDKELGFVTIEYMISFLKLEDKDTSRIAPLAAS